MKQIMQANAMSAGKHPLLGIAFVLMAVSCFVILDTSVKVLSASVSILLAVWFRYLCQALGMTLVVLPKRGLRGVQTRHPWLHVTRGAFMVVSSALSFAGLQYLPVAEITAIYMLTPLTITLLASIFLGERVTGIRWLLVFGGFAGAMLMIKPFDSDIGWTVVFPFSGMLLYSVFQILTSRMARTEDAMVMHMSSGWVGTLAMSLVLPWVWQAIPSSDLWGLLLLAGLMGTVGHFLLILAYTNAQTSTLAPYMYMQIAIAMLAGWLVFGHIPETTDFVGSSLIMVCGASAAWLASRPYQPTAQ